MSPKPNSRWSRNAKRLAEEKREPEASEYLLRESERVQREHEEREMRPKSHGPQSEPIASARCPIPREKLWLQLLPKSHIWKRQAGNRSQLSQPHRQRLWSGRWESNPTPRFRKLLNPLTRLLRFGRIWAQNFTHLVHSVALRIADYVCV